MNKNYCIHKNLRISSLVFFIFLPIFFQKKLLSDDIKFRSESNNLHHSKIKWENINLEKQYENKVIWEKNTNNEKLFPKQLDNKNLDFSKYESEGISSLNRSIVFNDSVVGPDISWLVPPGFKWNNKYKFDSTVSGHSGRFEKGRNGKSIWGWNSGDAVGNIYYQFLNNKKTSFGLNLGIRSVYSGSAVGGTTGVGESQSLGFRIDRKISSTAGFSFGAEQLLHFDGFTDTGRNIYLTLSKAIWKDNNAGQFPLDIYTLGVATGRMAEGNIKFLCSDLLGGSGTEYQ